MATVILEHSDDAGSDRLGEVLRDYGHQLEVIRLHHDEPMPANLDEVDAVVTCGGGPSALEDTLPWLGPEMEFLREAVAGDRAVVGICLGSQILGRALGGAVGPVSGGIELGWHEVRLTPAGREDPLHAGIAWTSMQPQWHRQELQVLPDGARLLASTEQCAHQAWATGLRTYGFQYHPEIYQNTLDRWADNEPEALREAGITRDQLTADTKTHYPTCARLARRLFDAMALLLMPLDRRYQGVAKDLHH